MTKAKAEAHPPKVALDDLAHLVDLLGSKLFALRIAGEEVPEPPREAEPGCFNFTISAGRVRAKGPRGPVYSFRVEVPADDVHRGF